MYPTDGDDDVIENGDRGNRPAWCPQPYPVQFVVSYTTAGKMSTQQLDEFPDLGQVAYSGCPTAR